MHVPIYKNKCNKFTLTPIVVYAIRLKETGSANKGADECK